MHMRTCLFPLTALAVLTASAGFAFSSKADDDSAYQPIDERKAQESLPMASGVVWNTLIKSKISYSNKEPHITAKLTPEIKAMNGRTITVDGFMLPMDSGEKSTHFLLSKRTPTCPFCPPGEPNEVIEVIAKKGVPYDDTMLTMQGTFRLTNNTENGIFFVMKDGVLLKQKKVSYGMVNPSGGRDGGDGLP
ncbi:MAG: DUF3299 domain-containing protein [Proteobacteria bacterium]|nr:DUF3299 domain-containing protein [Pseudomonadota bacterium]